MSFGSIPAIARRAAALVVSFSALAAAHSIWLESHPDGVRACFGEVEEGKRDSLAPAQNFDRLRAWGADGRPLSPVVQVDHVALGQVDGALVVHDAMPVHGEGKDAGRGVFRARLAKGAAAVGTASSEPLDIVPSPQGTGEALVLRGGKPAPGQKVSLLGPDGKGAEVAADPRGRVVLPEAPGRWLVSGWIEVAGKGTHLGKGYAKTWHVATLAWERP